MKQGLDPWWRARTEAGMILLVAAMGVWFGWAQFHASRAERRWREVERRGSIVGGASAASLGDARVRSDQARRDLEALGERWRVALGSRIEAPARAWGTDRTDAFFELAQAVEDLRERMRQAGVAMKEGERFGFETYRHAGPADSVLAVVSHQKKQVVRLMDAVCAGAAVAFAGLQRESPGAERAESPGLDDFFVPDPRLQLRVPTGVGQSFFRVAFIGETSALRGFLLRLAETSPDAWVRWIEARPELEPGQSRAVAEPSVAGLHRFIVTVAFIEWTDSKGSEEGGKS